jgi:hypothetical protein
LELVATCRYLPLEHACSKLCQELCELPFSVVELYLEALGSETQFTHEIVLAILQANGTALLGYVPETVQDFTILYRTVHNVPMEIHATAGMVRPRDTIRRSLISVIARTWENYFKEQKDNELCISLCKNTAAVSENETKYLRRLLSQCSNPFGAFYLMIKVHKETPSSRAIMSAGGSLLFSLGVWVDSKLQPFVRRQQAYFKNSQTLKRQLDATVVPENSYLFTADALSMYTNIPIDRALQLICDHIRTTSHLVPGTPVKSLCSALRIVM